MSNSPIRRRTRHNRKARLNLRNKLRPLGQTRFNVEVRVCPATNVPLLLSYGGSRWISAREKEVHAELVTFINTLRSMIGSRAKIIQHRQKTILQTKVLLENEADLVLLTIAHPTMICRAYRYIDR